MIVRSVPACRLQRRTRSHYCDDTGRGIMKLKNRPETLTVSLTFMPLFRNM